MRVRIHPDSSDAPQKSSIERGRENDGIIFTFDTDSDIYIIN